MIEEVILVDTEDHEVGTMEKLEAHKKGLLHRAFSVLLFNSKGELLLQKRSSNKYHSAGLWTNTCCSHPRPGEDIHAATKRRLQEEMGIEMQPKFLYKFIYRAEFSGGLTEHEFDYVFTGKCDESPVSNKYEVAEWKYMSWKEVMEDIEANADSYSFWFRVIAENVYNREKNGQVF